jgi:hypothetical protein
MFVVGTPASISHGFQIINMLSVAWTAAADPA